MHKVPKELAYTVTHEWIREEEDGSYTIGITDYAQDKLGEILFIELPEVGDVVHASDEVCSLESVKTATDVFSPLSGKIVEVNADLDDAPSLVNSDPFGDGWLYRITAKDADETREFINHEEYVELLEIDEE